MTLPGNVDFVLVLGSGVIVGLVTVVLAWLKWGRNK